jgi:hypothetical protein
MMAMAFEWSVMADSPLIRRELMASGEDKWGRIRIARR